ncbi:helix-turn-helix transcriptional regulator [Natronococcus sp.]|uniref:helix-turn-helix transcriptional regulator n=1 Tax=Natronococcus sp. TaxID=35747 RepID=UPI003A4D9FE6
MIHALSEPVATALVPSTSEGSTLGLVWDPHLAAVAGLVALVMLGGALVARNRLATTPGLGTESDPQRDEEFVTDRERVCELISENGGRMKQSKIVDSVDWSKAKVSRLLAELEEEEEVTKLRLGRENLVCLPGYEPTASKSPKRPRNE